MLFSFFSPIFTRQGRLRSRSSVGQSIFPCPYPEEASLLSFLWSWCLPHLSWDSRSGQEASWLRLTGTATETRRSQPDVVSNTPGAQEGREDSPEMRQRTSPAAALAVIPSNNFLTGLIMSVCLPGCNLHERLHKSLHASMSVGDNSVQAYVWVYPRHFSLFLLCAGYRKTVTNVWPPLFRKMIRPGGGTRGHKLFFLPPPAQRGFRNSAKAAQRAFITAGLSNRGLDGAREPLPSERPPLGTVG